MLDRTLPGIQSLKHVVVLRMENRSFDHMLGALHRKYPAIDGLTGNETNPDSTGVPVMAAPSAAYQSQLDPEPDHHFPAADLQSIPDRSILPRFSSKGSIDKKRIELPYFANSATAGVHPFGFRC